jgi:short-subunit dehydrogenase
MTTLSLPEPAPRPDWVQRYGPWAVVTGASDGLGREFAIQLAAAGLHVLLVARREDRLQALATALQSKYGVRTQVAPLDLGNPVDVRALLDHAAALPIGLLVASAGFGTSGPFLDADIENELAMIDLNCRSVAQLTHGLGRQFVKQGRGGIVLLSSLLAFQGVPRAANYAATKAWVQTLAEGLRLELAPAGVDVLAAAAGPTNTGFATRASMQMGNAQTPQAVVRATLRALGRKPTVRPGWLSWLLEASLSPLPRWARTRILALVMAGMTKREALPGA